MSARVRRMTAREHSGPPLWNPSRGRLGSMGSPMLRTAYVEQPLV